MIYASVVETVGKTPVVELSKLAPPGVRLFCKLESFNPGGSVKDRLALAVIERAEREGALRPGQTVVEATSGNTGIGLALVCAAKGYPLVVTMAESFSIERRRLMRFLGAKVVLTPASLKGSGMYLKALELAEAHDWFLPRQFENEANAEIHERTTGREILEDFADLPLDYFVATVGTGGTLKGVSRALRAGSPRTKVIVAEAENAALLGSGLPQPPPLPNGAPQSHPKFQPHPIQGTTPDFISKLAADAVAEGLISEVAAVSGADALRLSRELALKEGIFAGVSAGAAVAAALKVAQTAPAGSNILCLLPDTGERYLSTPLFDGVGVDMDDAEQEIAASTPSARFGVTAPAAAAPPAPEVDAEASAKLVELIEGRPVVLFALEWCEFCWSLRKLLNALGVPHQVVALDSVELQPADLGLRLRRALAARAGAPTIPQLFVGANLVGGCMDAFAAFRSGALARELEAVGVPVTAPQNLDPEGLLPAWLTAAKPAPEPA